MYYMHPTHRERILEAVCSSVNSAYQRFMKHNPKFSGEVVVAGHSLGGAILFELLRAQQPKLLFVPETCTTGGISL